MTSPSAFSQKGLSIQVSNPLVQGGEVIGNLSAMVGDYTHTISATGGYVSASFSIAGNNEFIENWLQFGLGRHIRVFNPSQGIIWEGYVNQLTANLGGASFMRGPLTDIGNRVVVWYTLLMDQCPGADDPLYDPTCEETGQYVSQVQFPTTIAEDLDSQRKYGIWEKVINTGDAYTEEAEAIRDLYLVENANPVWDPSLAIGNNQGESSVKIECRGYIDWLNYVYSDTTDNISVLVSNLIKTILGADPNNVFSTDYSFIGQSLAIHGSQFLDEKLAKTIILDDLLPLGGGSSDRWTFGFYKDRKAVYAPIPSTVEYIYYKTGKVQEVENISGGKVEPWDVVPCKWVGLPIFLTSFPYKVANMREDIRVFFAEEVTYTAPDQVNITGAKIRRLPQYLANLGLSGA